VRPDFRNAGCFTRFLESRNFVPARCKVRCVIWVLDELLMRERDQVDAPKVNELIFSECLESLVKRHENIVAVAIDAVRDDYFPMLQQ
jgi:hypothetical protein